MISPLSRTRPGRGGCRRPVADRGSGTVLTGIILLAIAGGTVLAVWVVGWVNSFQRAQRIADLSAVAGAHAVAGGRDGCAAARKTAHRNGGEVVACTVTGEAPSFVVLVEVNATLRPAVRVAGAPRRVSGTAAAGPA